MHEIQNGLEAEWLLLLVHDKAQVERCEDDAEDDKEKRRRYAESDSVNQGNVFNFSAVIGKHDLVTVWYQSFERQRCLATF